MLSRKADTCAMAFIDQITKDSIEVEIEIDVENIEVL
jgi:hypothetical protein